MKNSNSKKTTKGGKNVTKTAATQQVKNTAASTTRRVLETRDAWEVIFNHSVSLLASYAKGIKVEKPREGFEKAFGSAASSPNSRAYAKSLIWGFATNRAGKVLKNLDAVATPEAREKIALAILVDTKLVRNGSEDDIKAQLARVETKREKAIAEAVLAELSPKPEKKSKKKTTTPKGGSSKPASKGTKPSTKGGKAKGESEPKAETTKATPSKGDSLTAEEKKIAKRFYDEWIANDEVEDFDDDRTTDEVIDEIAEYLGYEEREDPKYRAIDAFVSNLLTKKLKKSGFVPASK